jgi:kexin
MVFWGSSIDPSKAVKYQEPIVDNILPPAPSPHRPIVNDPAFTSATQHAKPTEHLPPAHAPPAPIEEAHPSTTSSPDSQTPFEGLVSSQNWRFMTTGALLGLLAGLLFYLWRRRVARKRLAQYTSLAADDIHMDTVNDSHVIPTPTRRSVPKDTQPSLDDLDEDSESFLPPTMSGRLGFHSGFLDDEPSSPAYPDGPERTTHSISNSGINSNRSGEDDENTPWLVVR